MLTYIMLHSVILNIIYLRAAAIVNIAVASRKQTRARMLLMQGFLKT